MKKILCLAMVIIMTASLMVSVSASVPAYATAQDGTLMYEVDFRGTSGVYAPVDGRGSKWYSVNPQVSQDGKSVTVQYTETAADGTDPAPTASDAKARARFCSNMMDDFSVRGKSYTVQFTLDSKTHVGVHIDGNTGFIINPSTNSTYVGQTDEIDSIGEEQIYDGTGASKQTYAIEMSVSDEITTNFGNCPACAPTVYRLYVLDETANNWRLVRELDWVGFTYFEFEYYDNTDPSKIEDYAYFYLSINCYGSAINVDEDNNPITATVSDMKIFKGIDFMTKGESAVITDEEDDLGGDDGSSNNTTTPPANDNKNTETTDTKATETTAATETEAVEEKGCGGVIGGVGVALVSALAAGVAVKSRKKKEN